MKESIEILADRFINHTGAYYQQWTNGTQYGYKAIYQAPKAEIIASHMQGNITIAAPALDENNSGRWICFDSDTENGSLDMLDIFLRGWHWHTIREARRSCRDGHLWLLFDSPVAGEHLHNLANAFLELAGLSHTDIEVFPKQVKANKLANGVRLPLGIHRKPGANNCRGLFDISEKDIHSQLTWLIQQPLNDTNMAIELAKLHAPVIVLPIRHTHTFYKGQINFKEIARATLLHARSIVEAWLPGGTGNIHYSALNPRRNDNHKGSFNINLAKGCWKDFATSDAKGNDLISLVAYLDNCSQLDAAKKLAGFIGFSGV